MKQLLLLLLFASVTHQSEAVNHDKFAFWDPETFSAKSSSNFELTQRTVDDSLCERQLGAFRAAFDSREMWSLRRK